MNTLYEEDPNDPAQAGWYCGTLDLFQARHRRRGIFIDIDWAETSKHPHAGTYRMLVMRMIEDSDPGSTEESPDWDRPLSRFETMSRLELVSELESWLIYGRRKP